MADTVISCPSACVITVRHELSIPVLDLSVAEASQIGAAILLVWGVGFGVRALIRSLRSDGFSNEENL